MRFRSTQQMQNNSAPFHQAGGNATSVNHDNAQQERSELHARQQRSSQALSHQAHPQQQPSQTLSPNFRSDSSPALHHQHQQNPQTQFSQRQTASPSGAPGTYPNQGGGISQRSPLMTSGAYPYAQTAVRHPSGHPIHDRDRATGQLGNGGGIAPLIPQGSIQFLHRNASIQSRQSSTERPQPHEQRYPEQPVRGSDQRLVDRRYETRSSAQQVQIHSTPSELRQPRPSYYSHVQRQPQQMLEPRNEAYLRHQADRGRLLDQNAPLPAYRPRSAERPSERRLEAVSTTRSTQHSPLLPQQQQQQSTRQPPQQQSSHTLQRLQYPSHRSQLQQQPASVVSAPQVQLQGERNHPGTQQTQSNRFVQQHPQHRSPGLRYAQPEVTRTASHPSPSLQALGHSDAQLRASAVPPQQQQQHQRQPVAKEEFTSGDGLKISPTSRSRPTTANANAMHSSPLFDQSASRGDEDRVQHSYHPTQIRSSQHHANDMSKQARLGSNLDDNNISKDPAPGIAENHCTSPKLGDRDHSYVELLNGTSGDKTDSAFTVNPQLEKITETQSAGATERSALHSSRDLKTLEDAPAPPRLPSGSIIHHAPSASDSQLNRLPPIRTSQPEESRSKSDPLPATPPRPASALQPTATGHASNSNSPSTPTAPIPSQVKHTDLPSHAQYRGDPQQQQPPPTHRALSAHSHPLRPFFFQGQYVAFVEDGKRTICIFERYLDGDFCRLKIWETGVLLNRKFWDLGTLNETRFI